MRDTGGAYKRGILPFLKGFEKKAKEGFNEPVKNRPPEITRYQDDKNCIEGE
jgi:hypothetical protein